MLDVPSLVSRTCYILTVLFNSTLIYLTMYHTKEIVGTYRNMIVTFATIGIGFSTLDILVRPLFHSYNGCLLYFTLGSTFRSSKTLSEYFLLAYCGMYAVILGFLTVQFMYRAAVLSRPNMTKQFAGWKLAVWVAYTLMVGAFWAIATSWVGMDEPVFEYLRDEILDVYGVEIREVAGFAVLAYNGKMSFENIRWKSVICISCVSLILTSQYILMLLAGIAMYRKIKVDTNTSSTYYANLQKQFFMTLIYQVSAPSLIFHAPALIVLTAPFFDFKFSFHSQIVLYGFSIYPLIDSLIVLNVISEYKNAVKKCFALVMRDIYECMGGDTPRPPPSNVSFSAARLAMIQENTL